MNILVTGGAGYIGSVIGGQLLAAGHRVVIYDNLAKGHRDAVASQAVLVHADVLDVEALRDALHRYEVDAVVHMAAWSLVGESMSRPGQYYQNNLCGTLGLLDAMTSAGVSRIVFSSTAAVYGNARRQPIDEDDETLPTNPYGETKLAVERALYWYSAAHGLRFVALRYFNAAGATAERGERHSPETHLIPLVLDAAEHDTRVSIFGSDYPTADGSCVRDYVHVADLANAHVMALDGLSGGLPSSTFNLGTGRGYSVKEVIAAAERVSGRTIRVALQPRRSGDPAVLVANADRIRRVLGWIPARAALDDIVGSAWAWRKTAPNAAASHMQ